MIYCENNNETVVPPKARKLTTFATNCGLKWEIIQASRVSSSCFFRFMISYQLSNL